MILGNSIRRLSTTLRKPPSDLMKSDDDSFFENDEPSFFMEDEEDLNIKDSSALMRLPPPVFNFSHLLTPMAAQQKTGKSTNDSSRPKATSHQSGVNANKAERKEDKGKSRKEIKDSIHRRNGVQEMRSSRRRISQAKNHEMTEGHNDGSQGRRRDSGPHRSRSKEMRDSSKSRRAQRRISSAALPERHIETTSSKRLNQRLSQTEHTETTSSKRLNQRLSQSSTGSSIKKDGSVSNKKSATRRESSYRSTHSITPVRKKKAVDLASHLTPKPRRKSDGQKSCRQKKSEGNPKQRRHTTGCRAKKKDNDPLLVVQSLQLVLQSDHLVAVTTTFPVHSQHDGSEDDASMKEIQHSSWKSHDGSSITEGSQHSVWSRSFSTVPRALRI